MLVSGVSRAMFKAAKAVYDAAKLAVKPETLAEMEALAVKAIQEVGATGSIVGPRTRATTLHAGRAAEKSTAADDAAQSLAKGKPSERELNWVRELVDGQSEFAEFTLIGKMDRGMRGAWLMRSRDGGNHILKILKKEDSTDQIRRTAEISRTVDSPVIRSPQFERVGYTPSHGSWYIQEFLPGRPSQRPTDTLIMGMLRFNDRFANRGLSESKNWSDDVMNTLYHDSNGWQKHVSEWGDEGKELVQNVHNLVDRNRSLTLNAGDIVHGDFQHYNALVHRNGRLSGYVDWEGAGRGDRGFDVARLLFDAQLSEKSLGYAVKPETLQMLSTRVADISGKQARDNYLGFWSLQLADFGVRYVPHDASMLIGTGRRVLKDLTT